MIIVIFQITFNNLEKRKISICIWNFEAWSDSTLGNWQRKELTTGISMCKTTMNVLQLKDGCHIWLKTHRKVCLLPLAPCVKENNSKFQAARLRYKSIRETNYWPETPLRHTDPAKIKKRKGLNLDEIYANVVYRTISCISYMKDSQPAWTIMMLKTKSIDSEFYSPGEVVTIHWVDPTKK